VVTDELRVRKIIGGLLWICVLLVAAPHWFAFARKSILMFISEVSPQPRFTFVLVQAAINRAAQLQLRLLICNVYCVIHIDRLGL
jgi:hypothetical protein